MGSWKDYSFFGLFLPENTVCAAYSVDSWYRATILSTDTETGTSYVKFLDYGGYAYVDNAKLRQIRADFMLLPFQAAECFLANVKPVGGMNIDCSVKNILYSKIIVTP